MGETGGSINAFDISGEPVEMPVMQLQLELRGAGQQPRGRALFEPVEVAVGDIALFARLLKGDVGAPAVLVGQDILTQQPTLFAARQRLVCVGSGRRKKV